ncbi:hypothetical protein NLG42_19570 [Flavobacterium plurextorum]|uniref:hypothetical protein n=1 Tax=Flavobacterium TaxID=237 RepID=UPI00214DB256|nr:MULTISPECIES: hypothetical protein [Flavobacterium]UUW08294.1 hypothetical protein NLG42_19570 [Flavobacterium plurextorum]
MEEIDYFKGLTNQEFIDYYKMDLYSPIEITLYTYPHEFAEEDPLPIEHINRCRLILYDYIYNAYQSAAFERRQHQKNMYPVKKVDNSATKINEIKIEETKSKKMERYVHEKKIQEEAVTTKIQELEPELSFITDEYIKKIKLNLVNL